MMPMIMYITHAILKVMQTKIHFLYYMHHINESTQEITRRNCPRTKVHLVPLFDIDLREQLGPREIPREGVSSSWPLQQGPYFLM